MHPKSSTSQLPPAQVVRMIHLALMSGVTLFAVVAWFAPGAIPAAASTLRTILPGVAILGFLAAHLLRRRLPARHPGETDDAWWQRAMPGAIMSWALLEAACLVACVTIFLSHDWMGLVWVGLGLLMFILLSPGRLSDSARSAP
ncbi:MAG TPA: hypothetical protein VFM12_04290 [Gemmatimonadales bacterium]|nr:hypothetical protein [Gemmatimonadales bacterium]